LFFHKDLCCIEKKYVYLMIMVENFLILKRIYFYENNSKPKNAIKWIEILIRKNFTRIIFHASNQYKNTIIYF